MATSMSKHLDVGLNQLLRLLFLRNASLRSNAVLSRNYSTKADQEEDPFASEEFDLEDEKNTQPSEDMIDQLRDVSNLPPSLRNRLPQVNKMPDLEDPRFDKLWFKRKMYAKFGSESGVDPRLMWPTRSELRERVEDEAILEPSLQERLQRHGEQKALRERIVRERQEKIASNMGKMSKWITDYKNKEKKKVEEQRKQEEKKQRMLEEAREYFGHAVSQGDVKFLKMMEEREIEEKKMAKQKRREKRQQKKVNIFTTSQPNPEAEKTE